MIELAHLASTQMAVAAESTSAEGGGPAFLLLLGPLGALGVYWALYSYYRNTDKSHDFENETTIVAQPVTGDERRFDKVKGTRRRSIDGDNVGQHRERVRRLV